jgi:5-methylcytosine-specific restriction endonuclease McrA
MDRIEHDLSDEQWTSLQAAWGGCASCGATDKPLQRDCVLAPSRGSRYTLENIVPACRSCNTSSATTKSPTGSRRTRLDERAFMLRHLEVRATLGLHLPTEPDAEPTPETPGPMAGPIAASQ